jgi:methylamine dehydrogenase accessory protein MauD
MSIFWILSTVVLWAVVLFLGFLLLGTLRSLGLLSWRLEQLEATTPKRLGRDGLKPGKKAPDFTLPGWPGLKSSEAPAGASQTQPRPPVDIALHDFAGRKVLLVFTQAGCSPCKAVIPELNRLERGDTQVLVVNNGDPKATQKWSAEVGARFPVLAQDKFSISKKYEVFATPFAFLIDAKGVLVSKGIINNRQHIRYVLSGTRVPGSNGHGVAEPDDSAEGELAGNQSSSPSEEVSHV